MNPIKSVSQQKQMISWATSPSPAHERNNRNGSAWESAIVELAEAGETQFVEILRGHVQSGVIRSERAAAALQGAA